MAAAAAAAGAGGSAADYGVGSLGPDGESLTIQVDMGMHDDAWAAADKMGSAPSPSGQQDAVMDE